MEKSILQLHESSSVQKNCYKKPPILQKWDDFENRLSCKGYSPFKMLGLGQKFKIPENMQKSILQLHEGSSVQKKNT